MTYRSWFDRHALKHEQVVKGLLGKGYSKEEIIEYFDFDNLADKEPDFCPLYAEKKKCHDLESLNCFLCACPYFRFNDEGIDMYEEKPRYSTCSINSSKGQSKAFGEKVHQDCSGCVVPHKASYVSKNYHEDWMVPMGSCDMGEET